ncbi:MAG TPA: FG-GAP-like repeat-containing protein [Candidatus Krumholzibacteria bacterium]|nr:FG-GAP-like repeat-containing protein [Candidatus Krumholzibacteria bacterium]
MDDDRLIDDAFAIADRRPVATTSSSESIRILDRLARLFGRPPAGKKEDETERLFQWGALEVRRLIGAGSFGEVYEAWDPTLHREVALKLRATESGALRWLDEARNLARVRHPHVVTVHGADVIGGRAGIWTERLLGRTLEEELSTAGPFTETEVLRIGRDIASALAAVHAAGLIHGDVKTSNIMLEDGDAPRRAVLVDFGSADRQPGEDEIPAYAMGTPLTMAPEVLDGMPASPGADVYGLGATLYRMLTSRYPVEATTIEALRQAHGSHERARVRAHAPRTSQRLARAIERALEPDAARRWPTAQAFGRALEDAADPTRRMRMRAAAIGAGVVGIAALSFILYLFLRPGGEPGIRSRLLTVSDPTAFSATWRHSGPAANDNLGLVADIIDLDHDGFGDVVTVEPYWKGEDGRPRGRVVIFRGSAKGPVSITPDMTIDGDEPDASFGHQAVNAGDTDGDGYDELLVSQEATDSGDLAARARLYKRDPSKSGALKAVWMYTGRVRDAGVGRGMSAAGDVNGDGFGDVLIGESNAPDLQMEEGRVMLFLGSREGLSASPAWSVRGGQTVTWIGGFMRRLGDMNGDGFDDVIVGASRWDGDGKTDCGVARIYLGSANGPSQEPALTVVGAGTNFSLGTTVGGAGDVNGDGYADALIGEPRYSDQRYPERGRILCYLGGPHGPSRQPDWEMRGPVAYCDYGYNFYTLGDVDGDGFDDIAVTGFQYSEGNRSRLGMVEVFRGGKHGLERKPLWRAIGDTPQSHFGRVIAAGDLNGDHINDLVVAAPFWGDTLGNRGLIVAYLHRATSPRLAK